jgi:small GTP-binding protein
MARVQLFLSTVSAEFLSYRERLRHVLTRPDVEVKVQEDFIVTGEESLEMLDAFIQGCDGVIHLVGDMTGAMAKPQTVAAIAARYPDLVTRFPLGEFLQAGGPCLSYTQWEAWLALLHNKPLFLAIPSEGAARDVTFRRYAGEKTLQQAHLRRLKEVARYPGTAFSSEEDLAAEVLRSFVLDLLVRVPEITSRGERDTLNYHLEIQNQGIDHLYEAKVLIIGDGGSGKTSLLRRLYQAELELPQADETTKGIDIHRHEFITNDGKPFRLNIWDFGGQEIYHATHQFFLTRRSLYILVDDTKNNSKSVHDEGFKYWLEVVEAFSDHSQVLIFQNEKGDRSKTIDEPGIKGRFPNVVEVFSGNLEHRNSVNELAKAIRFYVQKLPHVGEPVPAQWVEIREELEVIKRAQPFISQMEYFQIYARHLNNDRSKALLLSNYFHDLGVFLHFQEDPLLARTVILKNDWATDAAFKVLDDEPTKIRKGYFNRDDCQRIWVDSTYADMHPELLALMERFELCYKLPDLEPETWLTPQLLSPSQPEIFQDWNQPGDLVLTYQYDFMPKGIFSRLMVRKHHLVRQPSLCWIGGAFFERGTSKLLARLTQSGQEIEFRARGPERKEIMNVITSDLDILNSGFEGLKHRVRKLVPCNCTRCQQSIQPILFTEEELQDRKHAGKRTIECRVQPYENVSVYELLDGLKLDELPQWAKPISSVQSDGVQSQLPANHKAGHFAHKRIKIFLASSSELSEDRDSFDLHFRQTTDELIKRGIYLEIIRWENFLDAMSQDRLQDEYNKALRDCDIFISLFKTKTGKFTEEEFDIAHETFKKFGKPFIFTYFMQTEISNDKRLREALNSLWDFQDKLTELGHYHTTYTSIADLKLQFGRQLNKLIDDKQL